MKFVVLFTAAFALLGSASSASIDRYESEKPAQITVINMWGSHSDRRAESISDAADYERDEEYDGDEGEYDDVASGSDEINLPRVAMSSKPKDQSAVLEAERNDQANGTNRKGKRKGKGKKRDPCLKKYKAYCIHGTCQYVKELRAPSCVCFPGFAGERCHTLTLKVVTGGNYDQTTALVIMAVVLSSLCLTVIAILLAIKYHKRGAYDVENEEKVKLGTAPQH
ncbi:proheparin-binding EGF-like growth factor [Brienomyrus brachyistius]|uniref:proheparin-binding EGF-like growth factor n=1 Tax=Brienomyrus brachyistius TaxID=42636 RepID=UPI0020B413F9|nr:proheparin-binding EGF-like growth factor [Brienomyrus brachyistius]